VSHRTPSQTSRTWSRRQFLKATAAAGLLAAWRPPFTGRAQSDMPADLLEAVEREDGVLNVFNWSDYIDEDTIPNFESEFGIEVVYDTYESNDEMRAKLQASPGQFDVVVPTQDNVIELRALERLQALNHDWLPNLQFLDAQFVDPSYDPGNRASAAYQWGTTGIAYNAPIVGEDPRLGSWSLVFEAEDLSGKLTMLNDPGEVIGEALKFLGFSMNSGDEDELAAARDLLLEQKPWVRAYIGAEVKPLLITEDIWVANLWSGDVFQVRDVENENVRYSLPREGGEIWVDSMAIPQGAPHPATAHLWINYVLRPEVSADISNYVFYATPNEAAIPMLDPELAQDPVVFPDRDVRDKLEFLQPPTGESRALRDRIWEELKA